MMKNTYYHFLVNEILVRQPNYAVFLHNPALAIIFFMAHQVSYEAYQADIKIISLSVLRKMTKSKMFAIAHIVNNYFSLPKYKTNHSKMDSPHQNHLKK